MQKVISFFLFLVVITTCIQAQVLTGSWASEFVPGAQKVWHKEHRLAPAFIRYEDDKRIPRSQFEAYYKEAFGLTNTPYDLRMMKQDTDQLGHIHDRFVQLYAGIPVEGSMVIVHTESGEVYAVNGDFFEVNNPVTAASVSEKNALQTALDFTGANTYTWDSPNKKSLMFGLHDIQDAAVKQAALPKGELVIVPIDGLYENGDYRLAWKFDIFATEPLSRTYTFVDAIVGNVIHTLDRIHTADTVGTGITKYSGTRPMTTDYIASLGQFRLRETGRGNGIVTLNMETRTNYGTAVDFLDFDNIWDNVNSNQDEVAADAHWGAEMTYDYFFLKHGRNSIDGQGFLLQSFVHYSTNFGNAFWTGDRMVYGDGQPGSILPTPLTTIDICGHEITHGLTTFSAGLVYRNESGALNESFSDIFGKAIEAYGRPTNTSWRIGADLGTGIRDMQDPSIFGDPKNYFGNRWYTGTGDNGGVHFNSGVQNHWYYLMVEGGSGINDFGNNYTVSGMGMDTASSIAFRNLTVYLTPGSQYIDARFFAIESAIDLYGPCGRAHVNTANAWHAVGVGNPFSIVPIVDFTATDTTTCTYPYEIKFKEETLGAGSYLWDFGDGTTSNMVNPTHAFPSPGMYTVTLDINGVCGGTATKTKTSFITVLPAPAAPTTLDTLSDCRGRAVLIATGTDQIQWRNSQGFLLAIGDTFFTGPLNQKTTFFAYNTTLPTLQTVGAPDSTIGNGGYLNSDNKYLVFDVYRDQVLESVTMYASFDGYRIIEYRNNSGNVLESKSVFLSAGKNRVSLGFNLVPGVDQEMAISGRVGLFGNIAGMNYPYDLSGAVSIKGINDNNPTRQYLFFYNWEVRDPGCTSEAAEAEVTINPINVDPIVADQTRCGAGSVTFTATVFDSVVNWYDVAGTYLASGPTFTTPSVNTTTVFLAENERLPSFQKIGPVDKSIGVNNYFRNFFDTHLKFSALQGVTLKSVWVDADQDGTRTIFLNDGNNVPVDTLEVFIPAGPSRLTLDWNLPAGDYLMGGLDMGLSRTTSNLTFPYTIPGVFEITGSSNGLGTYFYFYDFEIQEEGCVSNQIPVTATITPGPSAVFSFIQNKSTVDFSDLSTGATGWTWDFGDGNTSTLQNPTNTYLASGTYTVTLTTTDGSCDNAITQTVMITQVTAVDPLAELGIQLFPNPGTGTFIVEWETAPGSEVQIEVFDMIGKQVYHSGSVDGSSLRKKVTMGEKPAGAYLVRIQMGEDVLVKKYVLR